MNERNSGKSGAGSIIAATIIIGAVLIICTLILRSTIITIKGYGNTISVTGAAFRPIESDFAIWEAELSVTTLTIEEGYVKLKKDLSLLKAFLDDNGFGENDYEITGIQIRKQFDRDRRPIGVTLARRVRIELEDVGRISKLARDASTILEKGVELVSFNPQYLCTKLDDLKVEMIKAATENARLRAGQLAETAGKKVGAPTSARVGIFQIRPLHSQEVSAYGISDVSSIDKEIACTVHISFLID
ncbi:MAG: SIMPL domain-containing protein [Candidatus Zixiibacteriota bacterium]|nr:MAG: SIMPL domain-containing protein [candidate division Zixibacteria bacterium]